MVILRRYLGLLLVAALLLTAHSAAASRAQREARGQVILCTGSGPVTIYVDATGTPTGPPHLCPDCIPRLLALAPVVPVLVAPDARVRRAIPPAPRAQWDLAVLRRARARAPPLA